jgi:hypothetical protein
MIPFGDGTHSKGGPDFPHLTFIQSPSVGEDGENLTTFHTQKAILVKEKK